MKTCSVCHSKTDAENLAVLTMTALAAPRYLCPECEDDFDKATLSKSPEEISVAIDRIGKKMVAANNDDELILKTVTEILEEASERAELIKNGEYDFSNDEASDGDGEIPPELVESEEDKELDRKEEESRKKVNKVIDIVTAVLFFGVLGFIIYKIITMFI